MDPFDEFEMKPITEGLGFHKKAVKLKDQATQIRPLPPTLPSIPAQVNEDKILNREKAKEAIDELLKSLNESLGRTEVQEPLAKPGREKRKALDAELPLPSPQRMPDFVEERVPERSPIRPEIFKQEIQQTGIRRGAADSPPKLLHPTSVSVASCALDAFMVMAIGLIFLVALLVITRVDLPRVTANAKADLATQFSLIVMFLAILQMYVIVSRSFFGRTLGEWTFDLQMGTDSQIKSIAYPFLVLWRSLVVAITGFVVLPILSAILGTDVTYYLTGLQLYERRG